MRSATRFFGETHESSERVVRPVGDLTAATAAALRRSVAVPLSQGAARIVLDLSLTRRIDRQGRAALVECSHAVRAANGTLVVLSAPGYVKSLLRDSTAQDDAQRRGGVGLEGEVDELGEQRRRLEAVHGRRVCAAFVSRTATGHPMLCVLSVGHDGTHQWD